MMLRNHSSRMNSGNDLFNFQINFADTQILASKLGLFKNSRANLLFNAEFGVLYILKWFHFTYPGKLLAL